MADRVVGGGMGLAPAPTTPIGTRVQRAPAEAQEPKPSHVGFPGGEPAVAQDLGDLTPAAQSRASDAVRSLQPGWAKMEPLAQGLFQQAFDPAHSGEVDDSFVNDVRDNFRRILGEMQSITFRCNSEAEAKTNRCSEKAGRIMWVGPAVLSSPDIQV